MDSRSIGAPPERLEKPQRLSMAPIFMREKSAGRENSVLRGVGIKGVIGCHGGVRSFDAIVLLLKTILSKYAHFTSQSHVFQEKDFAKTLYFAENSAQADILRRQALSRSHFKEPERRPGLAAQQFQAEN